MVGKAAPAEDPVEDRDGTGDAHSPCSSLQIRLFGRPELTWGQEPLPPLRSAPARSLLAYLIVQHGRTISRDALVGTLWPERPEVDARKRLSNALWHIRNHLGPAADRLEAERDAVTFHLHPGDWLDLAAFRQHLQGCREMLPGQSPPLGDLSNCLDELAAAVTLYRADLIMDCYDDWALLERERLWEEHLWALEQLVTLYKQWGNYDQALVYARRLVEMDPLRESAHGELMHLYHVLGRERAALEQYATLCRLLHDELEAEPTAATTALYQELLAAMEEPGPVHLPMTPPDASLVDLAHLPFVGRAAERAAFLEAVRMLGQGHGGTWLIEGPAGVGKTRLVEEAAANARWHGFQVALGRAELDTAAPFQSLREALSPLLTPLRLSQLAELVEPYHLGAVAAILPVVAESLPDLPTLGGLPPSQQRQRMWAGLARCIAGLGQITPLLLVLEDLHGADRATLDALKPLIAELNQGRVLVILSCRTVEARQRPAVWQALEVLEQVPSRQRLILAPLPSSEAQELARRALGQGRAEQDLLQWLAQGTGGNPLWLIETIRSLWEAGTLYVEEGRWRSTAVQTPLPVVTSVQALVRQRLERLRPAWRNVLEAAAVLGEEADFATLAATMDVPAAELLASLGEMERLGFLAQSATAYTFEHALVREGVYRHIAPTRRRALHRRAGESLEQTRAERVEALAHHFRRAALSAKALTYALASAERAQRTYDYQTALDWYEQALPSAGDDASRWDVLAQQEQALEVLGRREDQSEILDEMQRLAEVVGDPLRRARTAYRQGWRAVRIGQSDGALSPINEAVRLARSLGDRGLLGRSLTALAYVGWNALDLAQCQAAAQEAMETFQAAGDRQGERQVLALLGNLHLGLTYNYAQALRYFQATRDIEREAGRLYGEASALLNQGISYIQLGAYARSQECLAESHRLLHRVGDPDQQAIVRLFQGSALWGLGELAAAQVAVEEARQALRQIGNHRLEVHALSLLARIVLDHDDPERAYRYLQEMFNVAEEFRQPLDGSVGHSWTALVHLHLGRLDQAREQMSLAIAELESETAAEDIFFMCYRILAAAEGLSTARPDLERAYHQLLEQAERIDDPQLRRSFLQDIPLHRAILEAHETGRPPPVRRRMCLPAATAPTGRPLRDDEHVEVLWTIFASDDGEVRDRVASRRRRLRRLLEEAAAQGAGPTVSALADALDVSARTVKRDLAALRAAGHTVHTRGERG